MASTSSTSIQRILECSVCHDKMKDPVILHCAHTFCKRCLEQNLTQGSSPGECPMCREPLTPNELQGNFIPVLIIKNIQEALLDDATAGPSRQREMCQKHPQNEKKFACKHCKKGVCSECLVGDHWHSRKPRPKTIEQIKNEMEMQIEQGDKWNDDKNNYISRLSCEERDNEEAIGVVTEIQVQTEGVYNTALSQIMQQKTETSDLLSQKKGLLMEDKEKLKRKREEINEKVELVSSTRSHIEGALKRKHPDDIVSAYLSHSQNFETNLSTAPDPPLNLFAGAGACKKMYFENTFDGVVGKIDFYASDEDEVQDEESDGNEVGEFEEYFHEAEMSDD